jgi:hypothetical protein
VSNIHQKETLYGSLLILPAWDLIRQLRILFASLKCVAGLAMIDNTGYQFWTTWKLLNEAHQMNMQQLPLQCFLLSPSSTHIIHPHRRLPLQSNLLSKHQNERQKIPQQIIWRFWEFKWLSQSKHNLSLPWVQKSRKILHNPIMYLHQNSIPWSIAQTSSSGYQSGWDFSMWIRNSKIQ